MSIHFHQAFLPALLLAAVQLPAAVSFDSEVKPIFEKHCVECHGPKKQKSEFRLDDREVALHGGESHAPNIIPGKDADTEFVTRNIKKQTKAGSLAGLSRLDIDLHHYVVSRSGNARLLQLWEPLRWQWEAHLVEIYRRQKDADFIPEKETITAHKHLLQALAKGTPTEASQSMMNHILFNLRWAK